MIYPLALQILLAGCMKEIQLPQPPFVPQLVAFGSFTPENASLVLISTRSDSDPNLEPVYLDSAQVFIKKNSNLFKLSPDAGKGAGHYILDGLDFEENETYELQVSRRGFTEISAQAVLPQKISMENLEAQILQIRPAETENNDYYRIEAVMDLSHSIAGEAYASLYFEIETEEKIPQQNGDTILMKSRVSPLQLFPELPVNLGYLPAVSKLVFKKSELPENGKVVISGEFILNKSVQPKRVMAQLDVFSESYFLFAHSLERQSNYTPDLPIIEAEFIYTNVQNGFGYFSGFQTARANAPIE